MWCDVCIYHDYSCIPHVSCQWHSRRGPWMAFCPFSSRNPLPSAGWSPPVFCADLPGWPELNSGNSGLILGGKSSSEWKGLKSNPNMVTSSKVLIWCVMMMMMMMMMMMTMSYHVIWCHMMSCSGCLDQFATCQRSTVLSFVPWTCSGHFPFSDQRHCYATPLRHECNVYRGISLSGCAVLISGDGSTNYVI